MESDANNDYQNKSLAAFLQDVKRGGVKEVSDEYLLVALGWPLIRRYDLGSWIERFALRHKLIWTRDKKLGRSKVIRATS